MTRRIDADVRPDKAVVTNGHHGFIEYRPVEVGKESLAHPDVFAVVAEEWLVDERIFITAAKYLVQFFVAFLDERGAYLVVFPAAIFACVQFFQQPSSIALYTSPPSIFSYSVFIFHL